MVSIKGKEKITIFNSYLLTMLFFMVAFSVSATTILTILILFGWVLIADFKANWTELKNNTLVHAVILFFCLHLFGLLWSDDLNWGMHVLLKEWKLYMIPIFMLYTREEHIEHYIFSFILAMTISEFTSYGIVFEIIPPFLHATLDNPLPFMGHIGYNPLLAIAIYLLANNIIFNHDLSKIKRAFYALSLATMTINMFITGGRSGQVMFFVAIFILFFQYHKGKVIKPAIFGLIVALSIFVVAYSVGDLFKQRFDMMVTVIFDYENNKNTSTGQRIAYTINSAEIIAENPIFGVGTGDLPKEYEKVNQKNTPELPSTTNPHNMYTMEMVQFGVFGLLILLWIFYVQIKYALQNNNRLLAQFGVALPVLYFVINFGESYLYGHTTALLFAMFSSFLYKDYS